MSTTERSPERPWTRYNCATPGCPHLLFVPGESDRTPTKRCRSCKGSKWIACIPEPLPDPERAGLRQRKRYEQWVEFNRKDAEFYRQHRAWNAAGRRGPPPERPVMPSPDRITTEPGRILVFRPKGT